MTMKYKIHFEVDEVEDSIDIMGDTIKDIQEIVAMEMKKRGLDSDKNNCWSEEIK